MKRMRHCDRKQFKLVMDGGPARYSKLVGGSLGQEPLLTEPSLGSTVAAVTAVVGVVALIVLAWMWMVKPYIEKRWMTPRFLGHYMLYPPEGGEAEPRPLTEDPQPPGTTVANVDNANLFTGKAWKNRANARRQAEKANQRNANSINHPYLSDVQDHPAAMVPAVDAAGAPIALDTAATMADVREAIKDSGVRTVGLMRQGGVIRVFRPREGTSWNVYGQAEGPSDQTVAVFHLPKRQWWWKIVEGPKFE